MNIAINQTIAEKKKVTNICDVGEKLKGIIPYKFANKININKVKINGKQMQPFLPICLSTKPKTNLKTASTHNWVKLKIKREFKLKKNKKTKIVITTKNKYNDMLVTEKSKRSATLKKAKLTTSNFSIGENII